MKKRTVSILLSLLLMLSLVVTANAAGFVENDPEQNSLTLSYKYGETALKGAEFTIYQVASANKYAQYTVLESFKKANVTGFIVPAENGYFMVADSTEWGKIADDLRNFVKGQLSNGETDFVAAKGETDENGVVTFDNLQTGVYLVIGADHRQSNYKYTATPFLIAVPSPDHEDNAWDYQVEASVKNSRTVLNTYSDIKILKVWSYEKGEDGAEEPAIPESITVQVLRNGKHYKNITITAEDNWTYELNRLNDDYEWTFVEETVEGFTVSTEMHRDGRYIITNTWNGLEEPEIPEEPENPAEPPAPPVEPEQPELPATGALWWPVPLMAVLGIACFLMGWMRRRNYEN